MTLIILLHSALILCNVAKSKQVLMSFELNMVTLTQPTELLKQKGKIRCYIQTLYIGLLLLQM